MTQSIPPYNEAKLTKNVRHKKRRINTGFKERRFNHNIFEVNNQCHG